MSTRFVANKTSNLSHVGLALQIFYLNLALEHVNGSDFFVSRGYGHSGPWDLGNIGINTLDALNGFGNRGRYAAGASDNAGFFNNFAGQRNAHDIGKAYGGANGYGQNHIRGSGYHDVGSHTKGHVTSGFSNSYHKDERGDKSSYFDNGVGKAGLLYYGGHDSRNYDTGNGGYRGAYNDAGLRTNSLGNQGRYSNRGAYHDAASGGYEGGKVRYGYGGPYGYHRYGRMYPDGNPYLPGLKNTGLYGVPTPSKWYYDGFRP